MMADSDDSRKVLIPIYNPLPIALSHGEGAWVFDYDGNKYLDTFSGIAVSVLGHNHPNIIKAITEQAKKIIHTSNVVEVPEQIALANFLNKITGMDQSFFCNSGAEANETAIKIAKLYGKKNNIKNPKIIIADKDFHGRTLGVVSASGNEKVQAGFEPLIPNFLKVPFGNIEAINKLSQQHDDIVAIYIEPIQGEGGINIPHSQYLNQLSEICDQNNWLLMLDEVQTGIARTGNWFAYSHNNIKPDVLALAKSLGGGIPIGACMTSGKANGIMQVGNHGSTYGGNPLCCHTSLAVLETIEKNNLCENAKNIGEYLIKGLKEKLKDLKSVIDIRGIGLMIGVELNNPCRDIMLIALKHGLLLNVTSNNVIRLVPPIIINQKEADIIISKLSKIIEEYAQLN
tara:strand:+ start:27918 stop:29117 length:1200 start_codon:yes stop_codon:yes gene_type:complete